MWWRVDINNQQFVTVVESEFIESALAMAKVEWQQQAKPKQLAKGIYSVRMAHAKFGEVKQQMIVSVNHVQ